MPITACAAAVSLLCSCSYLHATVAACAAAPCLLMLHNTVSHSYKRERSLQENR